MVLLEGNASPLYGSLKPSASGKRNMKATLALFVVVAVAAVVVIAVASGSSPVALSQDISQLSVRELQARLQKDERGLVKSSGEDALAFAQDEAAVRPALKNALAHQMLHPASLRQRMSSVDAVMPTGRMFSSDHHHAPASAAGLVDTSQYSNKQLERLSSSQHALWLARANAFKQLEETGMQLAAKGRKEILDGFHDKKDAKVELQRAHEQLKDSLAAKTLYACLHAQHIITKTKPKQVKKNSHDSLP
jgi:hypothetical protein